MLVVLCLCLCLCRYFFVLSFVLSCAYAYYVTSEDQALLILYCVLSHDLFSVYLWEYLKFRMKFAANLNLKGHQFFFTHPVQCLCTLFYTYCILVDLHLRTYADLYSFMQCLSSKSKI